jgi:hypothetical protein
MVHTCGPSTQEAEAEGLQFQDQSELHSEILPQKKLKVIWATFYYSQMSLAPPQSSCIPDPDKLC